MPAMASAQTLDLIVRQCNNLHALVADTVGRASRNNLLVIAAVAPVLFPVAVLPLDYPHANPPQPIWLGCSSRIYFSTAVWQAQRVRP